MDEWYRQADMTLTPGDLIVSLVPMRGWESDLRKGDDGIRIGAGQPVLLIETWEVGGQLRLRVVHDNRIIVFSCSSRVVDRNWKVARAE